MKGKSVSKPKLPKVMAGDLNKSDAQNATLTAEVERLTTLVEQQSSDNADQLLELDRAEAELERLRDLIVAPIEARLAFDSYSDSSTTTDAMWHALCNAKVRAVDALSDEGKAIRAAREAGKA